MINFFGIVHQHGGCGTEALGAIELLRSRDVPVRCIVPPFDKVVETPVADYLRSIGVQVVNYEPGLFRRCKILLSFGEGKDLFSLMREHKDRPTIVGYSDCMHYASEDEVAWHASGLIDFFFFQTRRLADRLGPEISRRAKKAVTVRHGYNGFINTESDYFPIRFTSDRDSKTFTAIKVGRDDAEKWHPETWRMFCGISAPAARNVQIEIAGWGPNAANKIGEIDDTIWKGQINAQVHDHFYEPKEMVDLYQRAHALIHVCDYEWEEALGRVMLEAVAAGVVVIADRRGGALQLIRHGKTGFLVDSSDEASFFASRLAFDDGLRRAIAAQAYVDLITTGHGNAELCWRWWRDLITSHTVKPEPIE